MAVRRFAACPEGKPKRPRLRSRLFDVLMPFAFARPIRSAPRPPATLRRLRQGLCALALGLAIPLATGFAELDRMQQLAQQRHGAATAQMVADWRQMMAKARDLSEEEKLARVNSFFNLRIAFEDDLAIWKTNDYWATPLETMGKAAGDCEDFAIAKYITLRLLGIADEKLRLIYVRARIGGPQSQTLQAHMVLGYFAQPSAEPLLLDNLIRDIRPSSRRSDLFPVFSFNSAGLWVAGSTTSSADPTARLSRWNDALSRMRSDGIELTR